MPDRDREELDFVPRRKAQKRCYTNWLQRIHEFLGEEDRATRPRRLAPSSAYLDTLSTCVAVATPVHSRRHPLHVHSPPSVTSPQSVLYTRHPMSPRYALCTCSPPPCQVSPRHTLYHTLATPLSSLQTVHSLPPALSVVTTPHSTMNSPTNVTKLHTVHSPPTVLSPDTSHLTRCSQWR